MTRAGRGDWAPERVRRELVELLRLAGPVAGSRLGIMAMGLTDALVVGRYSAAQLGYHALGWAPTSVVVTTTVGLLSGVQVMTARALGEGRPGEAGAVLRRGLVYAALIGVLGSLGLAALGPAFLHRIGLGRALADGATPVLLVFSLSLTPYAVSVAATLWLEALGEATPVMVLMWLANAVNLAVDLALVPGRLGLPALGASGGAWATFTARTALALATLAYIALMPQARALGVFAKPRRDRAAEAEQRRIGYGAGGSNFFEVAAFAGMNIVAGWIGGLAVAAWAVVFNVTAVIFMVPLGLSTATAVMVGKSYGARDAAGVHRAAVTGFAVAAAYGATISLLVWPNAARLAGGFTADPAVVRLAAGGLALACLFFVPDALQVVTAQALRARGDVWPPTVTHLASYALVMGPLAVVLGVGLHLGLAGILWAVIAASLVSAGLLLGRYAMLARRGG
jgi:MATE family multidrug resistance protein